MIKTKTNQLERTKQLNAKQKGSIFYNNMEAIVPDFMGNQTLNIMLILSEID